MTVAARVSRMPGAAIFGHADEIIAARATGEGATTLLCFGFLVRRRLARVELLPFLRCQSLGEII